VKVGNAALDIDFISRREFLVCEGRQRRLRQTVFSRCANYQSVKVGNAALDIYFLSRGANYQSLNVSNSALDRHFYLEARYISL